MKRIENAGRTIEAEFSDEDARNIFLPLLRRFTHMRRAKGRRLLVMLAGPPASGKSTLAALLKALAEDTDGVIAPTVLGMDGFHWPQAYLRAHAVMRNGDLIPMTRVKGSPVSYDLQGLRQAVARVAAGEICLWPAYDRRIHDPVPDAIRVDGEIVLLEGTYLYGQFIQPRFPSKGQKPALNARLFGPERIELCLHGGNISLPL